MFESFRPGALARLGLDAERLAKLNPRASLIQISNYGQYGPYRDFEADDMLAYATSGVLQITGVPEREPVKIGLYAPLFLAGVVAAAMSFGALMVGRSRRRGPSSRRLDPGRAQRLDGPRRTEPRRLPVLWRTDVHADARDAPQRAAARSLSL